VSAKASTHGISRRPRFCWPSCNDAIWLAFARAANSGLLVMGSTPVSLPSDHRAGIEKLFSVHIHARDKTHDPLREGQMAIQIRRGEFITLLGGAAVAWPLAARAQQPERKKRIGVLMSFAADDPSAPPLVSAFAQGLQERGWVV